MSRSDKIVAFNYLPETIQREKAKGKKIVQCHGTFDLVHPGHVVHFEEAKKLGDTLVVTITDGKYVNKGPGRPYFNDQLRILSLTSLEFVDYVSIVPHPAAVEAIKAVQPDIYCKGKEYENPENDVTGNIHDDIEAVKRIGGKVAYVGSVIFSSSKLLNQNFTNHSGNTKSLIKKIAEEFPANKLRKIIDQFASLRVLVIGDLIFDKYSTVAVQGLTSKNRILSSRLMDENMQAGGALAIFRHVREFTPNVKLLGLVGKETWIGNFLDNHLSREENWVLKESGFTSIIKHRFVEPFSDGKELSKLFSVNHLDKEHPKEATLKKLSAKLKREIKNFDLVLVADFGHGVMSDGIRNIVQEAAPFLALNCQTNSNNYGFNIINRQYHRADSFSLDQTEMSLACGKKRFDEILELKNLKESFGASYGWFTRGGSETIGIGRNESSCSCDSLEKIVVDTVGAGDAFCAIASMAAVKNLPVEVATLFGQISGAIAVRIMGNSECVTKNRFLKSVEVLLNY